MESIITKSLLGIELNVSVWTGRKLDKRVGNEVAKSKGVNPKVGKYYKWIVRKELFEEIKRCANEASVYYYVNTLPWADKGLRVIKAEKYFEFVGQFSKCKDRFNSAVEKFVRNYPQAVADAKMELKDLFNSEDYPRVDEVRSKFGFSLSFQPIPTEQDFRIELGEEVLTQLKTELQTANQKKLENAMRNVWEKLLGVVGKLAERLDGKQVFRDSLVGNIHEMIALVPSLNLMKDQKLEDLAKEIKDKLTVNDPEDLRKDERLREETKKKAEEILDKMKQFMNPGEVSHV